MDQFSEDTGKKYSENVGRIKMTEEFITIPLEKYKNLMLLVELCKTARPKNIRGWMRRRYEIVRALNEISDLPQQNLRLEAVERVRDAILEDYRVWDKVWKHYEEMLQSID